MNSALFLGIVTGSIMSGTSLLYATLGEIVSEVPASSISVSKASC